MSFGGHSIFCIRTPSFSLSCFEFIGNAKRNTISPSFAASKCIRMDVIVTEANPPFKTEPSKPYLCARPPGRRPLHSHVQPADGRNLIRVETHRRLLPWWQGRAQSYFYSRHHHCWERGGLYLAAGELSFPSSFNFFLGLGTHFGIGAICQGANEIFSRLDGIGR